MPNDFRPPHAETTASHDASIGKGFIYLVGIFLLAAVIYFSIPLLAARIPWAWEAKAGRALAQAMAGNTCRSKAGDEALEHLRQRLVSADAQEPTANVHFAVLRGPPVNAFASLGGEIYVYEDLLREASSPEELAGVLAHEIAHVRFRHVTKNLAFGVFGVLLGQVLAPGSQTPLLLHLLSQAAHLRFSRGQEEEADRGGLERLRDAEINPEGLRAFFRRHSSDGSLPFLSDHPSSQDRLALLSQFPAFPHRPVLTAPEWKSLQGVCRGL